MTEGIDSGRAAWDNMGMADLPPEWQRVSDQLQAERAEQKEQLDQMMALLADNNRELKLSSSTPPRPEDARWSDSVVKPLMSNTRKAASAV